MMVVRLTVLPIQPYYIVFILRIISIVKLD